jgi:translocation and assembly module TamB
METGEDSEGQQLQRALLAARLAGGELLVDQTGIYSYIDEVSFETDNATEQTSLVVGKYLSPKMYVRYVTGVVESSNIVEVHYKLKRYLRVQTETGYRGSKSVAGADIYYTLEH